MICDILNRKGLECSHGTVYSYMRELGIKAITRKMDLKFSSLGKVEIKGQIGASFNEHFMRFLFQADQTIVSSMISFVTESLQEA